MIDVIILILSIAAVAIMAFICYLLAKDNRRLGLQIRFMQEAITDIHLELFNNQVVSARGDIERLMEIVNAGVAKR